MRSSRPGTLPLLAAVTALLALAVPAGATAGEPRHRACVRSQVPQEGPAREVLRIAEAAKAEMGLNSVILRVSRDGRELVTTALGKSMTGVPAEPAMHFRNGNVAISYLGTALLRLVDEGAVSLDDPVSTWLPDLPGGERITLRMLGSSTSGLVDYVTSPGFGEGLYADPFRQWTADELIGVTLAQHPWYQPGTNWNYSHANFVLLGAALERITRTPLERLLREKVLDPLGLAETRNGSTPEIPAPVLHAFTAERGTYEESTFWNPSWTTAPGAVQTTDICDLARSAGGIGGGELLSEASRRELLNPGTVGLGHETERCPAHVCLPQTEATHYGMGVVVLGDWVSQHPLFYGYTASQAHLPCERLSIAVTTTKGPGTPDGHTAQTITQRIAAALAPDHPIPDFG
ncbi:serine hydrolase domain-containing protein [Kitasatospora sp. NPDC051853]|uniref:serine hydrolase domain-containing protein n=1 Tax=Kitasatospora sp. NPDC051853 TaxID=3364058 RepID=UPI0037B47B46